MSMSNEERQRVLREFNDTGVTYPEHTSLHGLFEQQVAISPAATAATFEGESLTYRELDERANRLAHHLRSLGVGPEILVGICVERSLDMIVGLLGILKAGGAYVPIDPEYPKARIDFMLEDSQVAVLLTTENLLRSIAGHGDGKIVCLDRDRGEIAGKPATRPDVAVGLENLAYVIYTSGSTGKPKGAMNTHAGICNRLLWMQDEYRLTAEDVVLQKTTFTFDVSVWELFWPLIAGSRLVFARPGGHLDGAYLSKLIHAERVTVLHFVPSMLHMFLDEPHLERCDSLRDVICSGEALSFELQEKFFSRLKANLHNLYGPTEAAIDVTYWQCRPGGQTTCVPIGRPVANTQIYILDDKLKPVSIGTTGELHIGGVQVARGYLNRPELTAERFIPDPFQRAAGARLYKTGDQARHLPDVNVEFLGRMDHQVKIRGFRIELAEIESVLAGHAAIERAVVLAREDGPDEKRLVAYVTFAGERRANVSALRQFLEERLPDYMVPSAFVALDAFPLTPNGKLDRKALPPPEKKRPDLDTPYVAPRSPLERCLAEMWCKILEIDKVGADDRFFELGGTSLQAAQFVNALQKKLDEFIYIVTIFEAPSIKEYAALLQRDYSRSLSKLVPAETLPATATPADASREKVRGRVTEATISRLKQFIPSREARSVEEGPRNSPALFILAPPRSGTTLLRVMLAGHPKLFSAAELQLLSFNTLQERKAAFTGKYSLWLEGTIRAIMEINQCSADEAKEVMREYEEGNYSTRAFYRQLQEWIGNRILVDKSPAYACDPVALRAAEDEFQDALYIHLIRHPYAMVRSFESYHMDQVLFLEDHPFTARQLGEMVWTISHQNTVEFLKTVPANRHYRMRFEDLVRDPENVVKEMLARLGLEFHPEVLAPYENTDKKMTNGIYSESTPMGDTRFLEHKRIDPAIADRWKGVLEDDFLGDVTWEVAAMFGYEKPAGSPAGEDVGAKELARPSKARRNLAARQRSLRRAHRGREKQ